MQLQEEMLEHSTRALQDQGILRGSTLGCGAQGQVFAAERIRKVASGQHRLACAVKLHLKVADDHDPIKNILRELGVLSLSANAPHVVTLFDILELKYHFATLWELGEQSLQDLSDRNPNGLPREECLKYFEDVSRGLREIHGAGIVHGDVKPANMLLFGNGVVKIGDLGVSRIQEGKTTLTSHGGSPECVNRFETPTIRI